MATKIKKYTQKGCGTERRKMHGPNEGMPHVQKSMRIINSPCPKRDKEKRMTKGEQYKRKINIHISHSFMICYFCGLIVG
jgi:hypothetical protein